MKHDQKINRSLSQLARGIMIVALLINYLPVAGLPGSHDAQAVTTPAAAPVIQKDIDHTSLYIQSGNGYQRGVREYVTAASLDGGVLTYAWFINTTDNYLDGTDNATSGTFGDNGEGDGNTTYKGSYGTQSASSNILMANSPITAGKHYTYVEITNTTFEGESKTVRSKRAILDVRSGTKADKPNISSAGQLSTTIPDAVGAITASAKLRKDYAPNYWDGTMFPINTGPASQFHVSQNNPKNGTFQVEYGHSTNPKAVDTFGISNHSKYADFSTLPGAIYELAYVHEAGNVDNVGYSGHKREDYVAVTLAPSKFKAQDYSEGQVLRYWDSTSGITAQMASGSDQYIFNHNNSNTYNETAYRQEMVQSYNFGKYPYGISAGAHSSTYTETKSDPNLNYDLSSSRYSTDFFSDAIKAMLFGNSFTSTAPKDANGNPTASGVHAFDLAHAFNANASALIDTNKVKAEIIAKGTSVLSKSSAYTYGDDKIMSYVSKSSQVNQNEHGFLTIPEGQGAIAIATTCVVIDPAAANGAYISGFSVKKITKPNISRTQDYSGGASLTVTTKPDYAYALINVSYGYSQLIPNIQNYTSDASVDPSLGKGNNWFTTSNSSITFKVLASGETYRIIAIPKAAIQTETNSNVTPLDVLDTDAWVDTTIGIPKDQGQVLAGAYKSGTEMKGRVMLRQANPNNYYALLAVDSKGRPITGTPVKAWAAPDANGELEFDELDLLANDNKYVVITKPQAFFSFDYAQATYSPTEVYRSGDVIPSGFALNEPVMTATTVTITNKLDYQALSVSELTRTPGQAGNDTLTITYDPAYRGGIGKFPAGTKAIAFDKKTGTVAAPVYTVDLSKLSTATLSVPAGKDWEVILKFGDNHDLPILALAAPEVLAIDYVNENLLTAGKTDEASYNTQANIDYRLKNESGYYLGTGATTTVQGSNTQPISLTPALDDATYSDDKGQLTYTKHIAEPSRTVAVQLALDIPQRPAALTMGTASDTTIKVNYPAEKVTNDSGLAVLLSNNNFTTNIAPSTLDSTFADLGWTGNVDMTLYSRRAAIVDTAFKGRINQTTILERPAAPVPGDNNGVSITPNGTEVTFSYNYYTDDCIIQVGGTEKDGTVIDTDGLPYDSLVKDTPVTYPKHVDGNIYNFAFTATQEKPRSKLLEYSTPLLVTSIDFGDVPYGQLGAKAATTYAPILVGMSQPAGNSFPSDIQKKALHMENTGSADYYLDVKYDGGVMKFDNKGLFGFTGSDNLPDNYGGGLLDSGDFETLVNPNTIASGAKDDRFNIILGEVNADGNWTPDVPTNSTPNNINTTPVGLYTTRINLAYSATVDGNSVLQDPIDISAEIRLNIVKAKWANPIVATQAPQTATGASGTTGSKLNYSVTKNSLDFDLVLDSEIATSSDLEVSTNNGLTWTNPTLTLGSSDDYTLSPGQVLQHISLTGLEAASAYTVLIRVAEDKNHTPSDTITRTFWTREAEPTNKDQFVDYYKETLNFTSDYGVTFGDKTGQTDETVTDKFDANQTLTITAKTLASGNYPESEPVEFTYTRQMKPNLTPQGETVYYNGSGKIESKDTITAIEVRNEGAPYDGSTDVSKTGLFSGAYLARTPAVAPVPATPNSGRFASEEVKVLLLPAAYHVRVKSAAVVDDSIGHSDYARESGTGNLYLKKIDPQPYNAAFEDAEFSRIGYASQKSVAEKTQTFTSGGSSVIVTDAASDADYTTQLGILNDFKASIDSATGALTRKITWKNHEAPTYTVTIPATINGSTTGANAQVTIEAWNGTSRTIPLGSTIELKIADGNNWVLTNAVTTMAYSLALTAGPALTDNSIVKAITAEGADKLVGQSAAAQGFSATVTGTPQVAGNYTGAITFEVGLTLPDEGE